jgi:pyridoxine 5'-phosphate synthase PdxJ
LSIAARPCLKLDHVATLRQASLTRLPDPLALARLAVQARADRLSARLFRDRRGLQDRDVKELAIGHAILAKALFDGIEASVKQIERLMTETVTP